MKSPKIMYGYAAFLVICGFVAFAWSGFAPDAKTALIAPAGMGALMVVLGLMAGRVETSRTIGMIGIHAGMVLPLALGGMFIWLGYKRFTAEEPVVYLATIFAVMAVGSFIAFFMILKARPKPEDRG